MSHLLRSALDRVVTVQGFSGPRRYRVRPPYVGEALEIVAAAAGMAEGRAEYAEALFGALRRWLPFGLMLYLERETEPAEVLQFVLQLAHAGMESEPRDEEEPRTPAEILREAALHAWEDDIADYAEAFGADPETVYSSTSWPVFLSLRRKVERVQARRTLREMEREALPHIEDGWERQQAYDRLQVAAGVKAEMATKEEYLEARCREGIEELQQVMGRGLA